jgi:Zn-dependent peptidase ImmA (M78 family)
MGKIALINRTDFPSKDILEIASALCESQSIPSFYLLCNTPKHDGLSITNLDKPAIIIVVKNLSQFAEVFVHELEHLQQHGKGYIDEDKAYQKSDNFTREIVVGDKHKTKEEMAGKLKGETIW